MARWISEILCNLPKAAHSLSTKTMGCADQRRTHAREDRGTGTKGCLEGIKARSEIT